MMQFQYYIPIIIETFLLIIFFFLGNMIVREISMTNFTIIVKVVFSVLLQEMLVEEQHRHKTSSRDN